jgi:hypothetical protein
MATRLKIEKRGDEVIPLEMHFFVDSLLLNHPMTISSKFCSY